MSEDVLLYCTSILLIQIIYPTHFNLIYKRISGVDIAFVAILTSWIFLYKTYSYCDMKLITTFFLFLFDLNFDFD